MLKVCFYLKNVTLHKMPGGCASVGNSEVRGVD